MANRFASAPARAPEGETWCGPYAAAVAANVDYATAYNACVIATGREVRGMHEEELVRVLKMLEVRHRLQLLREFYHGYDDNGRGFGPMTLTQWYRTRREVDKTYLVTTTTHFAVVRGTRIIDNQTACWVPFHARKAGALWADGEGRMMKLGKAYKRSRVYGVIELEG